MSKELCHELTEFYFMGRCKLLKEAKDSGMQKYDRQKKKSVIIDVFHEWTLPFLESLTLGLH